MANVILTFAFAAVDNYANGPGKSCFIFPQNYHCLMLRVHFLKLTTGPNALISAYSLNGLRPSLSHITLLELFKQL